MRRHLDRSVRPLKSIFLALSVLPLLLTSCESTRVWQKQEKIDYIARFEKLTIEELVNARPEVAQELEESCGYAVLEQPVIEPGQVGPGGVGVVIDKATGKRVYLKIRGMDLATKNRGPARVVVIGHDPKVIENLRKAKWYFEFELEDEPEAVEAGMGEEEEPIERASVYAIMDSGSTFPVTMRALKAYPDRDLL